MPWCRPPASTPPADKPFDQVKEQLTADWLADKQHEAAEAKAKEIAEKAKTGDLAGGSDGARPHGARSPRPSPAARAIRRTASTQGLAASLFAVKQGETAVGDGKDGPVVAKVTAITPPDPAAHPDDVATLTQGDQQPDPRRSRGAVQRGAAAGDQAARSTRT